MIAGDELTEHRRRVGTSDGTVNGATDGDTRFVYSRLVETEMNLGGKGTSADDIFVNADGSAVLGGRRRHRHSDRPWIRRARGWRRTRYALNLGQLSAADAALVDLNLRLDDSDHVWLR